MTIYANIDKFEIIMTLLCDFYEILGIKNYM